ncbi:MAG TPA: hypothetical protein PLD48_06225, partial [Bacillota bacterium]|nr:hypothetical protein [Bacillota bacterium]
MKLYDSVIVGFRYLLKQFNIRPDELRSAFAEDAEDLRCFHPNPVIRIVQETVSTLPLNLHDKGRELERNHTYFS